MHKKVVIVGAGGQSRVIEEIIKQNDDILIGFLDDKAVRQKNYWYDRRYQKNL